MQQQQGQQQQQQYAHQLASLNAMGFSNQAECLWALQQTGGELRPPQAPLLQLLPLGVLLLQLLLLHWHTKGALRPAG